MCDAMERREGRVVCRKPPPWWWLPRELGGEKGLTKEALIVCYGGSRTRVTLEKARFIEIEARI